MSTYTGNTGIEKIVTGAQSGTWGTTTNTNFDIIDRALNGVGAVTLTGTSHTLTTSDGSLSDGQFKVLVFGGTLSSANTITISPNDADKLYFVYNNTSGSQNIIFSQGSGANVTVPPGATKIIYADGAGSGAAVSDFTDRISASNVNIDGGAIDGTAIGANSATTGAFSTITGSGDVTIDTNTFKVDTANNRVGVLQASPTVPLEVGGVIFSSTGGFKFPDNSTQTVAASPFTGSYAVTTGSSNVYAVAPSPALGSYAAGVRVFFEPNHINTGSATLNVNSLGAKTIKTVHGETLVGGELASGGIYSAIYDGTDFILVNGTNRLRGCMVTANQITLAHNTVTQFAFASADIQFDTSSIADHSTDFFTLPDDVKFALVTASMTTADSVSVAGVKLVGGMGIGDSPGIGSSNRFNLLAHHVDDSTTVMNSRRAPFVSKVFEMPLASNDASSNPRRIGVGLLAKNTSGSGTATVDCTVSVTILG